MIIKETIDRIMETVRIEEVVGDFVDLKKRGTSLIGNCPFHNEKTPSFHVSVTKGIYKCFGCGAGGDSLKFVMEHEKYSYPEALKFLAKKYNITVEETENTAEENASNDKRESLLVVTAFAAKFFQQQMWESDEGRSIGLSYFKERGFREDIIRKFELGYSPEGWDSLIRNAASAGHNEAFLEETGLAIRNDKGRVYDRFRTRVMFPIHNFTGRIIGFGGRTLKTDKSVPKYVNSPESEIYHKSNVLYGLFLAKKAIRDKDNCYLVEGYADVLSVHQAGVENVVASSGTSLTTEQIRLISRFTKNITILYDGDAAGIKASLRGLDMILEEGLNVKVVSFPDGHDPDSYVQAVGGGEFTSYIEKNTKDFILYKTSILLKEAANDPIKKAEVIRDVVESIAKIPDSIKAAVFIRECSSLLQMEERMLMSELNKIRLNKSKKDSARSSSAAQPAVSQPQYQGREELPPPDLFMEETTVETDDHQEKEIVRLLLNYGHELVNWDEIDNMYIGSFIISNLSDVSFEHAECKQMVEEYRDAIGKGHLLSDQDFIQHKNLKIADLSISMLSSPYNLSENWYLKRKIFVRDETMNLKGTILGGIFHLKKRKVERILGNLMTEIQQEHDADNQAILMKRYLQVKEVEKAISSFLGSVILK